MIPGDADGFLAPAYGERSLGDLVPAVATALGLTVTDAPTAISTLD